MVFGKTTNLHFCWMVLVGLGIQIHFAGSEMVKTPRFTGDRPEDAIQQARLAGFEPCQGVFFLAPAHFLRELPDQVVHLQSISPNRKVPLGTRLGLWTYVKATAEQEIVKMPDLRRLSVREATEKLKQLKLAPMTPDPSQTWPDSVIANQYPRPDQPVYVGTGVHLVW